MQHSKVKEICEKKMVGTPISSHVANTHSTEIAQKSYDCFSCVTVLMILGRWRPHTLLIHLRWLYDGGHMTEVGGGGILYHYTATRVGLVYNLDTGMPVRMMGQMPTVASCSHVVNANVINKKCRLKCRVYGKHN